MENRKETERENHETKLAEETVRLLPTKQRLYIMFKPLLYDLTRTYPTIYFSIGDKKLVETIHRFFEKVGFSSRFHANQELKLLSQNLSQWLKKNNLVLIHYNPQYAKHNLIDLMRQVKKLEPRISFTGLIPIFVKAVTSQQQLEVFRLLGNFGVKYAMFLTPNVTSENNLEEMLEGLVDFSDMLQKKASKKVEMIKKHGQWSTRKIDKYNELYARGEKLVNEGKIEEAIKIFNEAIELKPDFNVLMQRGDAFFKIKKYVAALNDFREANKLNQSIPLPYAKIGACCLSLISKKAGKEETENYKKIFQMGMQHIAQAEELIEKRMRENRNNPEKLPKSPFAPVLNALAESDIRGLGLEEEEKKVNELVKKFLEKTKGVDYLDPDMDIDPKIDRAVLLARGEHYGEAERIFRSIIEIEPSSAGPAFNNFAVELRKNGQNGKAFEIYMELLQYEIPDKDIVVENMKKAGCLHADSLKEDKRLEEAVSVYKRIITCKPSGQELLLCELAQTYMEMKDQAQASLKLMEAMFLDPDLTNKKEFAKFNELSGLISLMAERLASAKGNTKSR